MVWLVVHSGTLTCSSSATQIINHFVRVRLQRGVVDCSLALRLPEGTSHFPNVAFRTTTVGYNTENISLKELEILKYGKNKFV